MPMTAEKPNDTAPRELISAAEFNALTDKVLAHSTHCPCRRCRHMDELMNVMCFEVSEEHGQCRKPFLPGSYGCDEHPHHVPKPDSGR